MILIERTVAYSSGGRMLISHAKEANISQWRNMTSKIISCVSIAELYEKVEICRQVLFKRPV